MPYSTMPTPAKPYQTGPSNQVFDKINLEFNFICSFVVLLSYSQNLFQFPNQFNDSMHGVKQTVLNYLNQPMHM